MLGYRSQFTIYDQSDAVRLADWVRRDLDLDPKRFPPRQLARPDLGAEERARVGSRTTRTGRRRRTRTRLADDLHASTSAGCSTPPPSTSTTCSCSRCGVFREHPEVLERWRTASTTSSSTSSRTPTSPSGSSSGSSPRSTAASWSSATPISASSRAPRSRWPTVPRRPDRDRRGRRRGALVLRQRRLPAGRASPGPSLARVRRRRDHPRERPHDRVDPRPRALRRLRAPAPAQSSAAGRPDRAPAGRLDGGADGLDAGRDADARRPPSVHAGMVMVDEDGEFDVVADVERVALDAPVYDLDIEPHAQLRRERDRHAQLDLQVPRGRLSEPVEVRGVVSGRDDRSCSTRTTGRRSASSTPPTRSSTNNAAHRPKHLWTEQAAASRSSGTKATTSTTRRRSSSREIRRLIDTERSSLRRRRGLLPHQRAEPRPRRVAGARRHPVPRVRRREVLRPARGQGRARVPARAREPRRRSVVEAHRQHAAARRRRHVGREDRLVREGAGITFPDALATRRSPA